MLRNFLWETFEKTGNIEAYVTFKEIEEKNKTSNEMELNKDETAGNK